MANGSEGKDVLSSLPRSRPSRRSAKRDGAKPKAKTTKATAAKQRPTPNAQRPKARAKPKAATKPKVAGSPRPSNATRRARETSIKPPPPKAAEPAGDRDVITTAVEAAGELARIGLTVGTQLVREATRRIPRP